MGWTYTHKPAGQSVAEFFRSRWNDDGTQFRFEVLDAAVVRFRTAYLAVRRTNKTDGKSYVFAAVCLLNYDSKDPDYNFGYKDMDETMGPVESNCPKRILEQLSDLADFPDGGNQHAAEWRARCWKRIRRHEMLRKHPDWGILVLRPLKFGNGDVLQLFRKADVRRRRWLTGWNERGAYSVSLDREYLLLPPRQASAVWLFLAHGGAIEAKHWHHDSAHPLHQVFYLSTSSIRLDEAMATARLLQVHEDGRQVLLEVFHATSGTATLYTVDANGDPVRYTDDRPLVMTSAYGTWDDRVPEGYVGVTARAGGRFADGAVRFFLVQDAEYAAWRSNPDPAFVVDPERHREIRSSSPPAASKERNFGEAA